MNSGKFDEKEIMSSKDFDGTTVLEEHHAALLQKRKQLNLLIANVEKTIMAAEGETIMSDQEKFSGFVQNLVNDNERHYGEEIRVKYGDDAIDRSNAKLKGMTKEQYAEVERLSAEVNETLRAAFEQGDPADDLAQKACQLHKEWLCCFWDKYSKEAHIGVAQMYVDDPRFTAYYDKIAIGCAAFLRDAVLIYCQ